MDTESTTTGHMVLIADFSSTTESNPSFKSTFNQFKLMLLLLTRPICSALIGMVITAYLVLVTTSLMTTEDVSELMTNVSTGEKAESVQGAPTVGLLVMKEDVLHKQLPINELIVYLLIDLSLFMLKNIILIYFERSDFIINFI